MNGSATLGGTTRSISKPKPSNGDVRTTQRIYDNTSHMTSDLVYPAPPHCSCRLDDYAPINTRGCYDNEHACAREELPPPPTMLHDVSPHETRVHACPRGGRAWLCACVLVIVPMVVIITMATLWLGKAKKDYDWLEQRNEYVEGHLLKIVRLIVSLNNERECAALFVDARDKASEIDAYIQFTSAYSQTDADLASLSYVWPGLESDGYMYKSKVLFQAVLKRHREMLNANDEFVGEMKFYTDIIHTFTGWFLRDALIWRETQIWPYLMSYGYLLGSINLLGGEQTLCSVYHSVICFSHKEIFLYANYSFSGEAMFKMYRQSYPGVKEDTWESQSHLHVFPNLHDCRKELMADINYSGVSAMCDHSQKNETRFNDLDILVHNEIDKLLLHVRTEMAKELHDAYMHLIYVFALTIGILVYFILMHLLRCSCMQCQHKRERNKWRTNSYMNEDEKLAHIALNEHPTVIGFDDCHEHDVSTTSTAYIKVATV